MSNLAFSEGVESEKSHDEVRGYLMLGGSKLDMNALNEKLESKGNVSFSDEFYSIGFGFLRQKKFNWVFGAEGHVLFAEEQDYKIQNVNYRASLFAANGFFNVGYNLVSTGGLNIYPLIGFVGKGEWWKEDEK